MHTIAMFAVDSMILVAAVGGVVLGIIGLVGLVKSMVR